MDTYTDKVVLTFHSHYDAVRQRRMLKERGIESVLVPVPRSLSSSCGTSLLMDAASYPAARLIDSLEGAYAFKEGKWSGLPIR